MGSPDTQFLELQEALAGRYSLIRELGRGGMGVVYLGHEVMLDRPVAIKVLPPHFAADPEFRSRFLQEARTAARLQHPNIVPVHAVEEIDRWIVIAMAYVDGGTLAERVRRRGPLEADEAVPILRQVAQALAYAHRNGVVHRDVKPENILLAGNGGHAMITDFGIARGGDRSHATDPGLLLGTPAYMSPEQAGGSPVDGRSDLYSLGVVGHYILSGRLPFDGADAQAVLAQHLTQLPAPLNQVAAGVPERVARVVDRCLAKWPSDRFQDGEELAEELDEATPKQLPLPPVLAEWVGGPAELTLRQVVATPVVLLSVFVVLDLIANPFFGGRERLAIDEGLVIAIGLSPLLYLWRRFRSLRSASAAGFDNDALAAALTRQDRELNKQELPSRWQRTGMRLLGALALSVIAAVGWAYGDFEWYNAASTAVILGSYGLLLAGSWVDVGYDLLKQGRSWTRDLRRAFWSGPIGRWALRLAGKGRAGLPGKGVEEFHGTELALGGAAAALFAALPREKRKELSQLPDAIDRLEEFARLQRKRLAELDRLAAEAKRRVGSNSDEESELAERRQDLAAQFEHQQAAAARQLRDAVAALEMLRLDLLQLRAGEDTVGSITEDIERALRLSEQMKTDGQTGRRTDGR